MVKTLARSALILLTFTLAFYVGTAVFSIIDFPHADTSWMECNQAEDCD
jgi:hypothetical protein